MIKYLMDFLILDFVAHTTELTEKGTIFRMSGRWTKNGTFVIMKPLFPILHKNFHGAPIISLSRFPTGAGRHLQSFNLHSGSLKHVYNENEYGFLFKIIGQFVLCFLKAIILSHGPH